MALTVAQGFDSFLQRLTPTEVQRKAASLHRGSVEAALEGSLSVRRYREIGSFGHGTGVRHHYDVDLLVSLANSQPGTSDTALAWVSNALKASFPSTAVYVRRPAVVVDFAQGTERWEITPGFLRPRVEGKPYVYDIPGASSGWLQTAPVEHLTYVNEVNAQAGMTGGAKKLARFIKAWKYYNDVPMSSFYLEMRVAKYMATQSLFIAVYDVCYLFEHLQAIQLAAMNDPKGASSRIYACSTTAKGTEAFSKVKTAATRARKALEAHTAEDTVTAFHYLDLLFGGKFPAR